MLHVFQVEGLLPDQSQDSSWRAHHNVGAVAAQGLLILLDVDASKEHSNLHIITILRKTLILLINLKSQLPVVDEQVDDSIMTLGCDSPCMTQHQYAHLPISNIQLL